MFKPSNDGSHGALVKTSRSALLLFFFSVSSISASAPPSRRITPAPYSLPLTPPHSPAVQGPAPPQQQTLPLERSCLIQHCPSFTTRLLCPPPLRPGRRGRGRGPGAGGAVRLPPGAEKKGAGEVPHTGQTPGRAGPGSGPACRPLSRGDGQPNVQSLKGCIYLLR